MAFDPVRLELMKNALGSVADEMILTVVRIAYSSIMKDTMDLSAGICDRNGLMIAQGHGLPMHMGSIPDAMQAVLSQFGDRWAEGDVAILNDPYHGGMHLPDIFMFRPIFVGDYLIGYAVSVAHHNDVGGRVPGSSAADSTEIYQEGIRLPPVKLYERGEPNDALFRILALNVRLPDAMLGDLQAQVAACRIAERGIHELVARYGVARLESDFAELLDYSEREARRAIRGIPDGTYTFSDFLDDDGVNFGEPVPLRATVIVEGDELTVDLEGCSPQVKGAINSTLSYIRSGVYFTVRTLMDSDVPNNAGFFRPIHVIAPPGSIANPRPPAACAARGVSGHRIVEVINGAIAKAVPDRVRAAGERGTTSYSIGGYDLGGRYILHREAIVGAWGGGKGREGIDGCSNPRSNISNAPVERVENQAPVMIERYELVADSGGPGRWRGGMSIVRQIRFLGDHATLQLRSDRRQHPPYGLYGGHNGRPSSNEFDDGSGSWTVLPTKFTRPLRNGQAFRHVTAGAGAYGDPLERDPQMVLRDVRNGKVTVEGARRDYGVSVLSSPWRVDEKATRELRKALRRTSEAAA
ncbi:MAG: hydantoinase B/oxoprolinase family protein [Betaproteobacteria bacterium]|nr:hydantoinase B/oxoprolinase family protein [Betaproteobacteria bacterium]